MRRKPTVRELLHETAQRMLEDAEKHPLTSNWSAAASRDPLFLKVDCLSNESLKDFWKAKVAEYA